ncbi:hypothetical protein DY000_02047660 [Brassica cretica]|uniref:DUF4005 domain-containing protein n=1 Tax=Brassica cretica TaxID=69181 RepID=A0ABQ7EW28_BRACR|nr:hypothetical protein DY000_02047660 [Brassica cretica]
MYILYHRSMSRRGTRNLVPADFKPKASPNYKITPDECMPSSTRSNKDKHLLFSDDPAHLERSIRKDQRSTSIDAAAFTSTDSHTQPSTDTRPSSSTDLHRSTSIDTTPRHRSILSREAWLRLLFSDRTRMETCMTRMVICVMQQVRNKTLRGM